MDGYATQSARSSTGPLVIDFTTLILVLAWAFLSVSGGYQWFGSSLDNYSYYLYFMNLNSSPDFAASRFEPGFQAWAWVAKFILHMGFEPFVMSLIAVSLGIKFYLIRRYTALPIFAAGGYVLGFFFLHEYTQFRAALGIAFAFLGLHKQMEGKLKWAGLFYVVAILFHYSVVMVPVVALLSRFIKRWEAISLLAISSVVIAYMLPLIREMAVSYLSLLNPLTSAYFYGDEGAANIFSLFNVAMALASVYAIAIGYLERSKYHRIFLVLGISSLVGLALVSELQVLALRIKEVLAVAFIFAFTRSKPELQEIPLLFLLLVAMAYGFWSSIGQLFLF